MKIGIINTLLLNIGELMNRQKESSVAIYDTKTNDAEIIRIE